MNKYKKLATVFTFCTIANINVKSQNSFGIQNVNAFSDLNERRTKLNIDLSNLEKQIAEIYTKDTFYILSEIDYNTRAINSTTKLISEKSTNDTSISTLQSNIDYFKYQNDRLLKDLDQTRYLYKKREDLKNQLETAKNNRIKVENEINQLMIPKISQQNFMFSSSVAFVLLMSILLATFFFVVWRDEQIRRSIFGSDSGIQFIALFSIIIAVIIFGLTGILEGKELSALLGSVAGYILGKAKFSGENGHANPNGVPSPNHPPPPTIPPAPGQNTGAIGS